MAKTEKHLQHIPKIIHQSYARSKLDDDIQKNISAIKKLNSGWEYRFYDDEDCETFIKNNFEPYIFKAYQRINPVYGAARADFFRYLLIFKTGGVWLDIKSSITKPLDETLKTDDYFILSQWQNRIGEPFQGWGLHPDLWQLSGGEFQQWHIISAPENPHMREVIKRVYRNILNYTYKPTRVGKNGVVTTTGPIAYSIAIGATLEKAPYRLIDVCQELGFLYSFYDDPRAHEEIMAGHYAKMEEPVVLPE
jgi:inositol phosphorylceramide mannosyltransferase catalytic subunit